MALLTMTPEVALAFILSLLLVIGLVAFHRRAGDNILQFLTHVLDLYQRFQHLQHRAYSAEQQMKDAKLCDDASVDNAIVTDTARSALSSVQQQDASNLMGELHS